MREDPGLLLNKLSELVSKCRHENKFILVNSKVELKVEVKLKVAKLCILNSFAWYGIAQYAQYIVYIMLYIIYICIMYIYMYYVYIYFTYIYIYKKANLAEKYKWT